jgi:RimJ/RimL family protein N-acetyltransferase
VTIAALPYTFTGRRETGRLVLRPYADGDLDVLARLHGDEEIARWLYWEARGLDQVRAVLARKLHETTLTLDGDAISFAIELRETGAMIGDAVLILRSALHQQGEVGYIIDRDHQGRGYATEATGGLLEIAFGEVELHRVCGCIEPRNAASGRVLERSGMRHEATLLEHEWVKGEWQSVGIYALLRREWLDGRAGEDARRA